MEKYFEISLMPDGEMPINRLLNATYTKLHKALYDLNSASIGISFPKYAVTLGNVLRIHGAQAALHGLQGMDWLGGMKGYCKIGDIASVPANAKHRTVFRVQPTMSHAKLQRLIKRGSITEEEAKNYKAKMFGKGLDNPYLELQSGSNGHKHRRYIEFGPLLDKSVAGSFDLFGLSKTATVPWF